MDAENELRFDLARMELEKLLEHEDVKNRRIPILFFANKSDLAGAHYKQEIATALKLSQILDRPYHIFEASAKQGTGVVEGIDWLVSVIKGKS